MKNGTCASLLLAVIAFTGCPELEQDHDSDGGGSSSPDASPAPHVEAPDGGPAASAETGAAAPEGSPAEPGGGPGCDAPAAGRVVALYAELERADCRLRFSCAPESTDQALYREAIGTEERCVADLAAGVSAAELAEADALVAAGLACLDRGAVEAALAAAERDCAPARVWDALAAVGGTVEPGGACSSDLACARGGRCDHGPATCGVCRDGAPAGAGCSSWHDCARGDLLCLPAADGGARTCVVVEPAPAPSREGEPCGVERRVCRPGLWCRPGPDWMTGGAGACERQLALGAPCHDRDACGPGARCAGLDADEAGTCVALVVRRGAGEPCDPSLLRFCDPFGALTCGEEQTCEAASTGERGSPCRLDLFLERGGCGDGLVCEDGLCTGRLADGSACFADYLCASEHCEPAREGGFAWAGTCRALPDCGGR